MSLAGCANSRSGPEQALIYQPADEPMLVLVEPTQAGPDAILATEQLQRHLHHALEQQRVAPLVPQQQLRELRDRDRQAYAQMSIAAVGRGVGAEQVLYVELNELSMESPLGSRLIRGSMGVRLRIVDAQSGETRWPAGAAQGRPIRVQSPFTEAPDPQAEIRLRDSLTRTMSQRITAHFQRRR